MAVQLRRNPLQLDIIGNEEVEVNDVPRPMPEAPQPMHEEDLLEEIRFIPRFPNDMIVGCDPFYDNYFTTKKLTKKEELESNYVRVDIDEAAKKLCSLTLPHEDSDEFLELYDTYYELLFKCRK